MSKTPYELRLDVLAMAKESLEFRQNSRTTNLTNLASLISSDDKVLRDLAKTTATSLKPDKEITTEDILLEANKLYSFVQNDNKKDTK
jgi:hypothetical protein